MLQNQALCSEFTTPVACGPKMTSFLHNFNAQNSKERLLNMSKNSITGMTHQQKDTCEACSCISCKIRDFGVKIQRDLSW